MNLQLALKGEYFDQIKDGSKIREYRLCTSYWGKRLIGRSYENLVLTRGYPKKTDMNRRLVTPYLGYERTFIRHPHFGSETVEVFSIHVDVSQEVTQ